MLAAFLIGGGDGCPAAVDAETLLTQGIVVAETQVRENGVAQHRQLGGAGGDRGLARRLCRNGYETAVAICANNYVGAQRKCGIAARRDAWLLLLAFLAAVSWSLFMGRWARSCILGVLLFTILGLLLVSAKLKDGMARERRRYDTCVKNAQFELKACLERAEADGRRP